MENEVESRGNFRKVRNVRHMTSNGNTLCKKKTFLIRIFHFYIIKRERV